MDKSDPSEAPAPAAPPGPTTRPGAGVPPVPAVSKTPSEIGGPKGPEPTRFGDWERGGRCVDF